MADGWLDACHGVQPRAEAVALCPQKGRWHGRVAPPVSLLSVIGDYDLLIKLEQVFTVIDLGVCVSNVLMVRDDGGRVGCDVGRVVTFLAG